MPEAKMPTFCPVCREDTANRLPLMEHVARHRGCGLVSGGFGFEVEHCPCWSHCIFLYISCFDIPLQVCPLFHS